MIFPLAQKIQDLVRTRKEVRYVISGVISEGIEYLSFIILMQISNYLYFNNSLSFILGVLSGFFLHKTWSFPGEKRFKSRYQFLGYISLAGFNFIAMNVMVGYFVHGLTLAPIVAKFVAIVITVTWTFAITNYVIFRYRKSPSHD